MGHQQPRVVMPNEIAIDIQWQDGPLASPVSLVMPRPGGVQMLAVGGLMREEAVAAPIYAELVIGMEHEGDRDERRAMAELALNFAEDFLAVSLDRRKAKAEQQAAEAARGTGVSPVNSRGETPLPPEETRSPILITG